MELLRPYIGLLSTLKGRMAQVASSTRKSFGKRSQLMLHPRITIITPSYNQAQYLEDAIQSVLNQNYQNFEHIVIDGGSTDGTVEILGKYSHLKWISEKDGGQSDALNKGLRMATGDFIGIINSDDYYSRNAFRSLVKAVNVHTDAKVFIGNCRFIYEGSNHSFVVSNRNLSFEDIIRYWDTWVPPTQPSIFFRRQLIDEFGAFDCSLDKAMDYDLWLRFAREHDFHHIPRTLAVYRFHGKSKSGMGEDWSSFYDEWHQVYLRNKKFSKTLPRSPLISIILYLSREDLDSTVSWYRELAAFLGYVDNQRFQDLEIIIITDLDELEYGSISNTKIPIQILNVPQLTTHTFIEAIHKHALGRFIHCPSYCAVYNDRWYCDNLSILLDNYDKQQSGEPSKNIIKHKLLSGGGIIPCDTLFRWNNDNTDTVFSVIIPTYNRSSVLIKCLKALTEQDFPFQKFEVIVCDDGSTDDTELVVRDFKAPYSIQYLKKENGGPGAARNMGIRAARGKYLLMLNDDAIPVVDVLSLHKSTLDALRGKKSAVLGKFPLAPWYAKTPLGHLLESTKSLFAYPVMSGHKVYSYLYFYTCNLSIERNAVFEAGLFDDDFKGPAAEDLDLGYRLHQKGYRIYYNPDIVALHDHEPTPVSFYQTHKMRAMWGVLFMLKHPNARFWYSHYDFLQSSGWAREMPQRREDAFNAISELDRIEHEYSRNSRKDHLGAIANSMSQKVQFIQSVAETEGFLTSPFLRSYLEKRFGRDVSSRIILPGSCMISVIIPTYNRRDILLRCLDSLACQTLDRSCFEVIVCDDGSTDDTSQVIAQYPAKFQLRYLRQDNGGPASARNMGIGDAKADLVLFLNDDALMEPDALQIHLEEHAKCMNSSTAVLGRFSLHPDFNRLDKPVAFTIDHSDLIFDYSWMTTEKLYGFRHFYTCNISLDKSILRQVGCFDDSFTTAGAEDIELGYRLGRAGLSIGYRKDCVAWHAHRLEPMDLAKMYTVRGKGGVSLFLRHPELPHHYRGISLHQAREIRKLQGKLEPLVLELSAEVSRFNALSFSPPGRSMNLTERENGINFRFLWQAEEKEVRNVIEKLIHDIRNSLERCLSENIVMPLDDAAVTVYPALTFIKWYYDTVGIMESPFLEDLIEIESTMKARLYIAYACNYIRRKVNGGEYLYRR